MPKTVYFDQNIWSILTNDILNERFEDVGVIAYSVQVGTIQIAFSMHNIAESLGRTVEKARNMEFGLLKYLTNDTMINEKGEFQSIAVEEVIKTIGENRAWIVEFQKLFAPIFESLPKENSSDNMPSPWDSREINNVKAQDIFSHLQMIADNTPEFQEHKPEAEKTISFIDNLLDNLKDKVPDLIKKIPGLQNVNFEGLQEHIDKAVEIEKIKARENIGSAGKLSFKNPEEFIGAFGVTSNEFPGFITSFLEATRYWPDSAKLKAQKGKKTDMQDASHVNHAQFSDYFVTNDKGLVQRTKASFLKLGIKTEVLGLSDFLGLLKNVKS